MLTIYVPKRDIYIDQTGEFASIGDASITLEHSLLSLSRWESKWHKPFIENKDLTTDETIDYIRCMTITKMVPDSLYFALSERNMEDIMNYINDPMTATKIKKTKGGSREIMTSEIIYYLMISYGIPFECQKWHLSRLLALISVCQEKSQPAKMMPKNEVLAQNKAINAQRRAMMRSKG